MDDPLDNLAKSMSYRSVEPLSGSTGPEMMRDALNKVAAFEGTPAEKADLFETYVDHVAEQFPGFSSVRMPTENSSEFVFTGSAGELLVISPSGTIYRGTVGSGGITFNSQNQAIPNYNQLTVRGLK